MTTRRLYRFGAFEFDPEDGELRREGVRVRLEPQPTKVLGLLLERAGRTVTREELRRHVWGPETFVDFERGLAYCIAQVRTALGDSADSARYVLTLPRRGFQFLAPVRVEGGGEPAAEAVERARILPATGRGFLRIAPPALIVGAVALAVFLWEESPRTPSSYPSIRLAVAAFDNETGMPSLDSVSRGLSDAVVARLAELQSARLGVIGNAALLQGSRTFRDVKAIRRELRADYVVLGQLQRLGPRTRVTVHLIRAADETHLWAHQFDRADPDWFALQSEIAQAVARAVSHEVLQSADPSDSASPQAGS